MLLLLLTASVHAYPAYFVENYANGCIDHPTKGFGEHGKPVQDKTTTFSLTAPGAAAPAAALCPGVAYELSVSYGAQRRRTLLTASVGTLGSAAAGGSCLNRAVSDTSSATFTDTLTLPCTAKGPVKLVVTSAAGVSGGASLHYSNGGALPDNACTRTAPKSSSSSSSSSSSDVHFLLAAPVGGYVGLGFPATRGRMVPADAVIGYVDGATAQPKVSAYHLTDYSVTPSATNFNGGGWASSMGAAKEGGNTLLCFSRPLQAPAAAVAKSLDPAGINLNWAADDSTAFNPHALTGSMAVDLASGTASASSTEGRGGKLAALLAHGALMLAAFAGLMPLGALAARHTWLAGDKTSGGIKPVWFQGHRAVQVTAVVTALAGFIIALVVTDTPWSPAAATPHPLYNLHRYLGVVAIAFTLLQAVGGAVRPGLFAPRRPLWRLGHMGLGWLTLLVGVVVMAAGVVMMHELLLQPLAAWLLPLVLLLGLLLLAGVGLEVMKAKVEASGMYQPATHKFMPAAAGQQQQRFKQTGLVPAGQSAEHML
ncbi:hypothetical protein OEZ86_007344 [Tetradesmus obliquus]|nr:hypothetical protein OEZ86_007344 [Tetradesmus obliquus]